MLRIAFRHLSKAVATVLLLTAIAPARLEAQSGHEPKPVSKMNAPLVIAAFERDPNLIVRLVADDTQVAHPIAFAVDDFGRVFVAESFRYIDSNGGWTDIRTRMHWMDQDLASRSTADRRKLYESRLGGELEGWKKASERIRLLENPDESGVYRDSTVFATGFQDLLDGTIAGLLPTRDRMYVTNIPHLWELRGVEGRGATSRKPLHSGFGVRLGYLGHDLHGLCWGPDGRLYFSLGDRGARVEKDGKLIANIPDTGGVFRCESDGSNLELYAIGLRNPQELAFDALGNLWTCDNNADRGDKARWVWVLPGGDSGWRVGYQHLDTPVALGAWTSEKIWYPAHPDQAGHIVPPVANLAQGPSGVAAHPGTGVPVEFTGQFLVCDYLGDGGGIYSVSVKKQGAGFEMLPPRKFFWNTPANDVDFANDGAVLFSTWTGGITPDSGGALFRVESPDSKSDPKTRETAEILKRDPSKADFETLGSWLDHPDMRVRRHGQFELVRRGQAAAATFVDRVRNGSSPLTRITALWGLAQLHRLKNVPLPEDSKRWATDTDPDVRATAARVLGECRTPWTTETLLSMLNDPDDQVKLHTALAFADAPAPSAVPRLLELAETKGSDPWLRHGISLALSKCAAPERLVDSKSAVSEPVRHVSLIALRKAKQPVVAEFLGDSSPLVVADAARAIYEERLEPAFGKLTTFDPARTTELAWGEIPREAVLRRWIHINARLGQPENASKLANFAADGRYPATLRSEALRTLAQWAMRRPFDGVEGLVFDPSKFHRDPSAAEAQADSISRLLAERSAPEPVRLAAVDFAGSWMSESLETTLRALTADAMESPAVRARSLETLVKCNSKSCGGLILDSLDSPVNELKLVAIASIDRLPVADRVPLIRRIVDTGMIRESQKALQALATAQDDAARALIDSLADRYVRNDLPGALRLEVREAVDKSGVKGAALKKKLETARNQLSKTDPLHLWTDALEGGDPALGETIFRNRTDLACVRCHQPADSGQRVGPGLDDAGSRLTPRQLVEAIVNPNATIAEGFETVALALNDGTIVSGLLKEEFPGRLMIVTAEGKPVTVDKSAIEERTKGISLMPERFMERMSMRDLRDLVAYLATLKSPAAQPAK